MARLAPHITCNSETDADETMEAVKQDSAPLSGPASQPINWSALRHVAKTSPHNPVSTIQSPPSIIATAIPEADQYSPGMGRRYAEDELPEEEQAINDVDQHMNGSDSYFNSDVVPDDACNSSGPAASVPDSPVQQEEVVQQTFVDELAPMPQSPAAPSIQSASPVQTELELPPSPESLPDEAVIAQASTEPPEVIEPPTQFGNTEWQLKATHRSSNLGSSQEEPLATQLPPPTYAFSQDSKEQERQGQHSSSEVEEDELDSSPIHEAEENVQDPVLQEQPPKIMTEGQQTALQRIDSSTGMQTGLFIEECHPVCSTSPTLPLSAPSLTPPAPHTIRPQPPHQEQAS